MRRRIALAAAGAVFGLAVFGPTLAAVGALFGAAIARRPQLGAAVAVSALLATALYATGEESLESPRFADFVVDRPLANTAARLAWLAWTVSVAGGWLAMRTRRTDDPIHDDRTPLGATEGRSAPVPMELVAVVGTLTAIASLIVIGDGTWVWITLPIAVGAVVLLAAVHLPRLLRSDWTAIVRVLPGQAGDEERDDDVVHGSVWLLAGTAAVAIGSFVFWIVAARTATQESVGAAAALFSVVTFLNYASALGLPIALSRMAGADRSSSVLFTWMLAITAVSSLGAAAVFAAVAPGSVDSAIGGARAAGWLVLALMVAGMSVSVLVDVRCMTLRLWRWVFWRSVAISLIRVPFLFLIPEGDATLYLFVVIAGAYAVTGLAVLVALLVRSQERLRARPAPSEWRTTARFAVVNYAGQLAIQAPFFVVPIIVLTSLRAEENASFYVAWGIMSVVVISVQLVGQVLLVEGGRGQRAGQVKVALGVALAVSTLSLAAVVMLSSVIPAVYGSGYEEVAVLLVLLVGGTVPYSATVVGLNATRVSMDNRSTIVITFAFAALVLVPALVFTNDHGAIGASWAWLLGNGAAAIVVALIHRKRIVRWLRPSWRAGDSDADVDAPDDALIEDGAVQ